ncbi:MAG: phosphatidylglycerol lysyltransferase domain-containing protein [Pyrinomonadaceae bacterium]
MSISVLTSELTLAAGAGFSTLYLSLKNLRAAKYPLPFLPGNESQHLIRLQSLYGYNPHSLIAVSETDRAWFDFPTQSCAAYSEHGKIRLVAGDIIAPEDSLREATEKFIAAARAQNRIAAFMPVTERFARAVIANPSDRIKAVKIGASPYFDLQNWNPRGNRAKHLRANLNQGRRAGICVEEISDIGKLFQAEVSELCESWLKNRRAAVKFGWLFGLSPFSLAEHKRFFAARDTTGKLTGLLTASPIPARDGWYLEDVLRCADAPNGTTDLLICKALETFAAEGARLATLGTVPLASDGEDTLSTNGNTFSRQLLNFSRAHLQSIYGFEGLRRFKARFVPDWWESEYVLVPRGIFVAPRVANAFFRAILPNGLFDLAKRQIVRAVLK